MVETRGTGKSEKVEEVPDVADRLLHVEAHPSQTDSSKPAPEKQKLEKPAKDKG